jgi:hypothetical protein
MRTSNRILVGIGITVLVLIVVAVVVLRITLGDIEDHQAQARRARGPETTAEYDITDFSRLRVDGAFSVTVREADTYSVSVTYPQDVKDMLVVERDGDALVLRLTGSATGARFRADVRTPALRAIANRGAAEITVLDYEVDAMAIENAGTASVVARNCRIGTLELSSDGALNAEFDKAVVMNAVLDLDGVANVLLFVDGGRLTGTVRGFANVRYDGTLSEQSVQVDGMASVGRN